MLRPGIIYFIFPNGIRNGIINFCSEFFRREGARQGCGAYERDRWNNYFLYNFDLFKTNIKIFIQEFNSC